MGEGGWGGDGGELEEVGGGGAILAAHFVVEAGDAKGVAVADGGGDEGSASLLTMKESFVDEETEGLADGSATEGVGGGEGFFGGDLGLWLEGSVGNLLTEEGGEAVVFWDRWVKGWHKICLYNYTRV